MLLILKPSGSRWSTRMKYLYWGFDQFWSMVQSYVRITRVRFYCHSSAHSEQTCWTVPSLLQLDSLEIRRQVQDVVILFQLSDCAELLRRIGFRTPRDTRSTELFARRQEWISLLGTLVVNYCYQHVQLKQPQMRLYFPSVSKYKFSWLPNTNILSLCFKIQSSSESRNSLPFHKTLTALEENIPNQNCTRSHWDILLLN